MSRLATALQITRLVWRLLGVWLHIRRAFRKSRRAFAKALREGGLPPAAVNELLQEYDALERQVLALLPRGAGVRKSRKGP
jgi:hypothetical protein